LLSLGPGYPEILYFMIWGSSPPPYLISQKHPSKILDLRLSAGKKTSPH
jgi:hypothetical protein